MNLKLFIKGRWDQWRASRAKQEVLRRLPPEAAEISRDEWKESLSDPTGFYLRCFRFFHQHLPPELRAHRAYFTQQRRGFGEDAFHVMWFLVMREFRVASFLEIGVYRGQTLSLIGLLQRYFKISGTITGISPFSPDGDSITRYREGINYWDDTLKNAAHFSLPPPLLIKAYSTDKAALEHIASQPWSCVYIDGNHDYEVAMADWEACSRAVRPGGLIVLDDSALSTSFTPPLFATGGHSGPSRIAAEIDRGAFTEILQVGHNRVFQKK